MQRTPNGRPTPIIEGRVRMDRRGYATVQLELPDGDIEAMCLIGEFNGWSTSATPMRQMHGRWQAVVPGGHPLGRTCLFVYRRGEAFPRVMRLSLRDSAAAAPRLATVTDGSSHPEMAGTPADARRWGQSDGRTAPRKRVVDGLVDGTRQLIW